MILSFYVKKSHLIIISLLFLVGVSFLLMDNSMSIRQSFENYECLQGLSLIYFLLALLLVPLNWILESAKWQAALSDYKQISLIHSFYSILLGVSAGILTPARIGEYAGRMSLMEKEDIAPCSISTFISSLMQMVVTFMFGSIASIYIFRHYEILDISQSFIISGGLVLMAMLLCFLYFMPQLFNYLGRFRLMKKFLPDQDVSLPQLGIIAKVLGYSVLRYVVYALQYALVFYCFDINVGIPLLLAFIFLAFLCQSLLPLPPMASLIGRGGVALLLFSQLGMHEFVILSATFSLWVINLLLPAFCGMILFMNIRKLRFVFTDL